MMARAFTFTIVRYPDQESDYGAAWDDAVQREQLAAELGEAFAHLPGARVHVTGRRPLTAGRHRYTVQLTAPTDTVGIDAALTRAEYEGWMAGAHGAIREVPR